MGTNLSLKQRKRLKIKNKKSIKSNPTQPVNSKTGVVLIGDSMLKNYKTSNNFGIVRSISGGSLQPSCHG